MVKLVKYRDSEPRLAWAFCPQVKKKDGTLTLGILEMIAFNIPIFIVILF